MYNCLDSHFVKVFSVPLCANHRVDDPQNGGGGGELGGGGGGGECVKFVRVPVCYQQSRRVVGWTKFSGRSGSGFSPLFRPWLPSAQTIPTRQFSSSATTGTGENSPTTYTLQGSSLKIWVNFHPGSIPRQICMFFLLFNFFVVHKRTQSSASTKGGKKQLFRFVIQIFTELRIFTHCVRRGFNW